MSEILGKKLGPYEVQSALGAGGMGEVYLAKDSRIDRTVAIKVLPSQTAASPEVRQRFDREARAISSLNHPNICALYDIGHQDGIDYLVMEYLEGDSLSKILEKGPLPTADVLRIAMQVADALDKAHKQGLVHRDLKPGNIIITKNGAKLLDFGLAKWQVTGTVTNLSMTRTSSPLTSEGTIVGTFQYMSPEQLEGREADARSDLFSFGVVLYEMATGKRPFEGKSQASLIASIMKEEPRPISAIQPMTPPALERVVAQCLAKEPDDRWQSAGDLKRELNWITQGGSQVGIPAPVVAQRRRRLQLSWFVAGVATVLSVALLGMKVMQKEPERVVRRFVLPVDKVAMHTDWHQLSPDGKLLATQVTDTNGAKSIWIRPMNSLKAYMLPGTEGAGRAFWSPDSKYLAYFTGKQLKKVPAAGGPVQLICEATGFDGCWTPSGVILFDNNVGDSIHQVSASGGMATAATSFSKDRKESIHAWPRALPDGDHFLYLIQKDSAEQVNTRFTVAVGSLKDRSHKDLFEVSSRVEYSKAGYILHVRDGVLMAQPFDADKLEIHGESIPIVDNVAAFSGAHLFSVADDGSLVYQTGSAVDVGRLLVFDRGGKVIDTIGAPAPYRDIEMSPDGKRLAYGMFDAQAQTEDIWVYDLVRRIPTRLTFSDQHDVWPKWSPDGSRIIYANNSSGSFRILEKLANGQGEPRVRFEAKGNVGPSDWSRDGRIIAVGHQLADWDIWLLDANDSGKYVEFTKTSEYWERRARLSPDGRFLVYQSNESGKGEVYVQEIGSHGGKWQISATGGFSPLWSADGKEIFFVNEAWDLMAVPVSTSGGTFEAGLPKRLFTQRYNGSGILQSRIAVSADAQRFIISVPLSEENSSVVAITLNWDAALQ